MANIEEEHRDVDGSTPGVPSPPTMEKRFPARTMFAVLFMVAVVVAIAIFTLIPNAGTTP